MQNVMQVKKEHYDFTHYVKISRWNSYYMQIKESYEHLFNKEGGKILLIGAGDGIVPYLLKRIIPNVIVTTVDYAADLSPDICCDIRELSRYVSEKYDIVICCQVLEHLKFEELHAILTEFGKCLAADGKLIISLPDSGIMCMINISFPKFHIKNYLRKWCRWYRKDFKFNGEHYWEVNSARKYSSKIVREKIEYHFNMEKEYLVHNNPYHRFYIAHLK